MILDQKTIPFSVAAPIPPPAGKYVLSGKLIEYLYRGPVNGAVLSAGNYTATSDDNGNYSITLPAGSQILTISHTGYNTRNLSINMQANSTLDIVMYCPGFISLGWNYPCPFGSPSAITEITGSMNLQSVSGTHYYQSAGVELDLTLTTPYGESNWMYSEIVCWGDTPTNRYVGFIVYTASPTDRAKLSYAKRIPVTIGEAVDYHWSLVPDPTYPSFYNQRIVLTSRTRGVLLDTIYPKDTGGIGFLAKDIKTIEHWLEYNWSVESPNPPHSLYLVGNHSMAQVYDKVSGTWKAPGAVLMLPSITNEKGFNDILHLVFNGANNAFNIVGEVRDPGVLP
jgi:hypothetical protein